MTDPDKNTNIRNSILAGIFFGAVMGLLWSSILFGVLTGLGFGSTIALFLAWLKHKEPDFQSQISQDETVYIKGLANHFVGVEAVGGILFLTTKRLLHQPHKANIQSQTVSYPLSMISSVSRRNTFGIIPNGLEVQLSNGIKEKFVVNSRKKWIIAINNSISH